MDARERPVMCRRVLVHVVAGGSRKPRGPPRPVRQIKTLIPNGPGSVRSPRCPLRRRRRFSECRDGIQPGIAGMRARTTVTSSSSRLASELISLSQAVSSRQGPQSRRNARRGFPGQLCDGFTLLEPGLVWIPQWRPTTPATFPRTRPSTGHLSASAATTAHRPPWWPRVDPAPAGGVRAAGRLGVQHGV